jgi:thioredoxin 1
LAAVLKQFPDVKHFTVEDGKGRPLGRSFGVKLWPTFVFMKDGQIIKQMARPRIKEVEEGLQAIAPHLAN